MARRNGGFIGTDGLDAPDPPTGVTASSGDASISVAFTAPTDVGTSAITGFVATTDDGNGGTAIWNTCADSLCTESPFTGTCSAVDSGNSKLGVLCNFDASICPDSDEVPGDVSVSVSAPSIEELECTLPQCPIPPSGNVIIDSNCTLYNEIEITGSLNITGIPDANGTLPKIIDGGSKDNTIDIINSIFQCFMVFFK